MKIEFMIKSRMREKDEQFVAVQNEKKVLAARLQKVQGKEATITVDHSNREQPYSQSIILANPLPSLSLDTQKKPIREQKNQDHRFVLWYPFQCLDLSRHPLMM